MLTYAYCLNAFLQKVQSEHIRGKKAISSYGEKKQKEKGELRKTKVKIKLRCHYIYAQGPHPDYPPKC